MNVATVARPTETSFGSGNQDLGNDKHPLGTKLADEPARVNGLEFKPDPVEIGIEDTPPRGGGGGGSLSPLSTVIIQLRTG